MPRTTKWASVASPAAGADWIWTPSGSDQIKIISITAQLVTNATVDSRNPAIQILDQTGNVVYSAGSSQSQTASMTNVWTWDYSVHSTGWTATSGASAAIVVNPFPEFWVPHMWKVQSHTYLLQTGDQWSAIWVVYEDPFQPSEGELGTVAAAG